jgi:hypothetical protein
MSAPGILDDRYGARPLSLEGRLRPVRVRATRMGAVGQLRTVTGVVKLAVKQSFIRGQNEFSNGQPGVTCPPPAPTRPVMICLVCVSRARVPARTGHCHWGPHASFRIPFCLDLDHSWPRDNSAPEGNSRDPFGTYPCSVLLARSYVGSHPVHRRRADLVGNVRSTGD